MTGNGQADTVAGYFYSPLGPRRASLLSEESHLCVSPPRWSSGRRRAGGGRLSAPLSQELDEQKWGLRMGRLTVSADGKVKQWVGPVFS